MRGEMQAQAQTNASARVLPAPSQFRFFAQCFRFSSNGNPQLSEVLRRSTVLLLLARLSAPKVFAKRSSQDDPRQKKKAQPKLAL